MGEGETSSRTFLLAIRRMDLLLKVGVQSTLAITISCIADLEEAHTSYEHHLSHLE